MFYLLLSTFTSYFVFLTSNMFFWACPVLPSPPSADRQSGSGSSLQSLPRNSFWYSITPLGQRISAAIPHARDKSLKGEGKKESILVKLMNKEVMSIDVVLFKRKGRKEPQRDRKGTFLAALCGPGALCVT